ncbi:Tyrosine-specific transport protein [Chlamydiales bacterium STE3]|nr:Tyrosine-specific transport protein [Chlamydiales bacterium STE3]
MNRFIGGILLVSGTTIGAGMLALPVVTGFAGFFPSAILLLFFWAYMTYTALLILEVNLWMKNKHANMITMAQETLGSWGHFASWVIYLFLLYALTTAYLAGCGPIVVDFIQSLTGIDLPKEAGTLPLLVIFVYFIYKGTRSVDYLNRLLMIGLAISYMIMVVLSFPYIQPKLLQHVDSKGLIIGTSVIATSFGFHIIIPSLSAYLEKDVKKIKWAIVIGSLIPLTIYLVWQMLVLGIIPLNLLRSGYEEGANGAQLLSNLLEHTELALVARFLAFFAIVTSFLGVSLSLADFLADGFKIEKTSSGKGIVCLLTFGPPIAFALSNPRAFFVALDYAGTFGVVLLLGLMPALMVWFGKEKFKTDASYQAPGGKVLLITSIALSLMLIAMELAIKLNFINITV